MHTEVASRLRKILSCLSFTLLFGLIAAYAQTPTPKPTPTPNADTAWEDYARRRIAPTVGAGGAIGGLTGLFTVIDGKTLQKNDFTFSFSYSKFTRDPGNAQFGQVQYGFNFGLTHQVELFYTLDIFRGVRINAPTVLSAFYLPNSRVLLTTNQGSTPAAFVLAPINNRGLTGGIFRPINNQPLTAFPFIGQPTGNFGVGGAPPFVGTLGVSGVGSGNFGPAGGFPGIGSIFGSLLPGIVQTTAVVGGVTTPTSFSAAPSYLPDAPFINRGYGRSWLAGGTVGAKIRFLKGERRTNFGVVPFYRFYADKANSPSGFNALQNGASPGGNLGDFGMIGFLGSRVSPHLNLSANVGLILNSNPTSSLFGAPKVTLLDRPNELIYGVAADFPMFSQGAGDNQPIIELRGTKYVGGRTPNAFENDPIELITGNRYFLPLQIGPLDNIGFGLAYRRRLNSKNNIVGQNAPGFVANGSSSQANGLTFELFFGRDRFIDLPPDITGEVVPLPQPSTSPLTEVILPCPTGQRSRAASCPLTNPNPQQDFVAKFKDILGKAIPFGPGKGELDESLLRWEATSGRIDGPSTGTRQVHWNLTDAGPGIYELSALYPKFVTKKHKRVRKGDYKLTFTIPIRPCPDCEVIVTPPECPTSVSVEKQDSVTEGTIASFSAKITDLSSGVQPTYKWNVNPGRIVGRDDTSSITVDTAGLGGQTVNAIVTLGGLDPRCADTANGDMTVAKGDTNVTVRSECKLFDGYGAIKYNDEKARLDNFAIQLKEPGLDAYIIAYRGLTNRRIGNIGTSQIRVVGDVCPDYRFNRASDYLVNDRGVDQSRIHYIDGGLRTESSVDLWICPANKVPKASPGSNVALPPGPCITKGIPIRWKIGKKGKGAKPKRRMSPLVKQ